jgi:DNA-binding transcriptional ArsR family regulator
MAANAHEPRLARVAAMVADPARSRMLAYLMSGEYASAGELARAASVTAATASGHLARLREARFVVCEARGRHRYYRLADAEVAHALEALALVAERDVHDRAWSHPARQRLRYARCCYGHLAGRLGVAVFDALRAEQRLAAAGDGYALTAGGHAWLRSLGLEPSPPSQRRRFAYPCLDWSERRDHLAGQLADELCAHLVGRGWLRRDGGRALALTRAGERELLPLLDGKGRGGGDDDQEERRRSAAAGIGGP